MSKRPNILFIIADDHRFDAVGAFGHPEVHTPALDGLIERGVAFRGTRIMGGLTGAVCVPTRAAVHSGMSIFRATPGSASPRADHLTIDPRHVLMGQNFRSNGYRTFGTGKWHNDRASFNRSFEDGGTIFFGGMGDQHRIPVHEYDPTSQYSSSDAVPGDGFSTDVFCNSAINFLNRQSEDPFFLYIAMTSPHDPRMAPPPFAHMYQPRGVSVPPNFMDEHPFDNGDMLLRDELLAPHPRTKSVVQRHMSDYYAMISHDNYHLQRVFDALEANGQLENTIIIYTADHGLSVGQHGLLGKQNMYEHSTRIPLIMAGPGIPAGVQLSQLTYQIDIYPTLCELAGIPIPESVEGMSMKPLLDEPAASSSGTYHRETTYTIYRDIQRMVTDGEWKLIRYYLSEETGMGTNRLQLYNLANDPWEMTDLTFDPQYSSHLERLAGHLNDWMQSTDDFMHDKPILDLN